MADEVKKKPSENDKRHALLNFLFSTISYVTDGVSRCRKNKLNEPLPYEEEEEEEAQYKRGDSSLGKLELDERRGGVSQPIPVISLVALFQRLSITSSSA